MADPISGGLLIATMVSAAGAAYGGMAQSAMYKYQAGVADMNAQIAQQNAAYETVLGETQAQESGMKTRGILGQIRAVQGASGLDVNTGTDVLVRKSEAELGSYDQAVIRSNAARRAYGQEVVAVQERAQSQLDTMGADYAETAGFIDATSSILGGGGNIASKWKIAQMKGMIGQ